MVTATFVAIPLLRRGNRTFVLLHERDPSDLYYPSMLNTPGTVIRATDEDLSGVYRRLVSTELAGVPIRRGPVFVDNVYERIVRGREISLVHWVELENDISSPYLLDVEMLSDRVVPTDQPRIRMAAAHFQAAVEPAEPQATDMIATVKLPLER